MSEKKIRKRTEYHALVDDKENVKSRFKRGYQEYDPEGNLTRDVVYAPDGEIESALGQKFDDQNRLIEEIHYYEGGETGEHISYQLDAEGNRKEIKATYADESETIRKIERTEHLVSIKAYDESGEFESEEQVRYDGEGNVVAEVAFDEDRNITTRSEYTYDDQHRLQSKTEYHGEKEVVRKIMLEYGETGKVVSETHLNRKGKLVNRTAYEYDGNGNPVSVQNNHYLITREFDDNGRLLREESHNKANGLVEKFTEYQYDEDGLLLEERTFTLGEQYDLQPGIAARTQSIYIVTSYEYEFYP